MQWVQGVLSLGVKRAGCEAAHSRMRGAIPLLPQYAFMAWCSVKKRSTGTPLTYKYSAHPKNFLNKICTPPKNPCSLVHAEPVLISAYGIQ
jgi:hypothetical protein